MRQLIASLIVAFTVTATAADFKSIAVGKRPESVAKGFGGRYYVTVMNENNVPGDGKVVVLEGDAVRDFATGLDEPKGICFTGSHLVTTDVKRVWKIDAQGNKSELAGEKDFPVAISFLNDAATEPGGKAVYVTDMGANTKMRDPDGRLWPLDSPQAKELPSIGRVFRIGMDGKVTIAVDASPLMPCPNGVTALKNGDLLVGEFFTGNLLRARKGRLTVLATGYRGADAIEQDARGNLYLSSWTQGKVWKLDRQAKNATELVTGLQSAADFFLDQEAGVILLPDMLAGKVLFVPIR
jgi:sugar lactone lactonase YvrE